MDANDRDRDLRQSLAGAGLPGPEFGAFDRAAFWRFFRRRRRWHTATSLVSVAAVLVLSLTIAWASPGLVQHPHGLVPVSHRAPWPRIWAQARQAFGAKLSAPAVLPTAAQESVRFRRPYESVPSWQVTVDNIQGQSFLFGQVQMTNRAVNAPRRPSLSVAAQRGRPSVSSAFSFNASTHTVIVRQGAITVQVAGQVPAASWLAKNFLTRLQARAKPGTRVSALIERKRPRHWLTEIQWARAGTHHVNWVAVRQAHPSLDLVLLLFRSWRPLS